MKRLAFLFQLLLVLLLISCGDEGAGTISETDLGVLGHIVDGDGIPTESVEVVAMSLSNSALPTPVDTVQTDKDGFYHFDSLPTGQYRIEGQKKIDTLTYVALSDEFSYDYLDSFYVGIDTLMAPGAIQGVVQLEGASSAFGVDVFIPGTSFDAKCDAGGNFILTGIPEANDYMLAVKAAGYATDTSLKSLSVAKNDTLVLSDTIKLYYDAKQIPPAPTGLVASFNSATNEVTVTWDAVLHPNWKGFVVYRKDSSLTASEPQVVSGTQLVTTTQYIDTISSAQQLTYQYHVKSQDSSENRSAYSQPAYVQVKASEVSRMIGIVVDSDGAVLAGASVDLYKQGDIKDSFEKIDSSITDANGQYQISAVSSGTYYVECYKEINSVMNRYVSPVFSFDSQQWTTTPYDLGVDTLYRPGAIQGIVTLKGATDHMGTNVTVQGTSFLATTDNLGVFVLSDLPKGSYTLSVTHNGYVGGDIENIVVIPNDTTVVADIELEVDEEMLPPDSVSMTSDAEDSLATDTSLVCSWSSVAGETYDFFIATDAGFSTDVEHVEGVTSPYTVKDLNFSTSYYVRVDATNSYGTTTGHTYSFKTKADPLMKPAMIKVPKGTMTDSDKLSGRVLSFDIMIHEVTVEMYRKFKPEYMNLLGASKDKHPVASVSWGDAIRYANWLSIQNGLDPCYTLVPGKFKRTDYKDPKNVNCKWPHDTLFYEFDQSANGYRLPTSDEWQWAAGGADSMFNYATADGSIDSTKAWNDSWDTPSEIMQFDPNPLGLYDMSCNAWEMVWGMKARYPAGRYNYAAPADSANQHGVKMGDGFIAGEGKYAMVVSTRKEWYATYEYYHECGFRLAKNIE